MSRAATSIFVFGVYLVLLGTATIVVPNVVLAPFGLPPTSEVWLRVAGVLAGGIGAYYVQAARHDLVPFFRATIPVRAFVFLSFVGFVIFELVKPPIIIFGAVDLVGAAWTFFGLRSSRTSA